MMRKPSPPLSMMSYTSLMVLVFTLFVIAGLMFSVLDHRLKSVEMRLQRIEQMQFKMGD